MRRKKDQVIKNPAVVQDHTADSEHTLRITRCSTGKINTSHGFKTETPDTSPCQGA